MYCKKIIPKGIGLSSGLTSCFNKCRFCQINDLTLSNVDMRRFFNIMDKFWDYKAKRNFGISFWAGYSENFSMEKTVLQKEFYDRYGWPTITLALGGLPYMNDIDLRKWFQERQSFN